MLLDMAYGELPEIETTGGGKVSGFPVEIQASPTGPKTAVLRLPTTDELLRYLSAQKSIHKSLGRGVSETKDVPNPKADLTLFKSLRLDKPGEGEADWDEFEALYALDRLTSHRVSECERVGQTYVVTLLTPFGETTHTLRLPWQSEMAEYQSNVYVPRSLPHGVTEQRFPVEVPVKLYDKIILTIEGYSRNVASTLAVVAPEVVPPHHKRSVIVAVLSALADLDPGLGTDPN